MKVTILVAAGKVDKNLEEVLSCEGIMVFENTEQSAIEALAALDENTRTEPVVYITDATQVSKYVYFNIVDFKSRY